MIRPLRPAVLLLCGSVMPAQTASYTTFGTGCAGATPGSSCEANNPAGGSLNPLISVGNPQLAMLVSTRRQTLLVSDFEIYTDAPKPVTLPAWIYLPDSTGKPAATPLATGSLTVGTQLGWYKASFAKPVVIAGQPIFFLSWSPGTTKAKTLSWPWLTSGTKAPRCWKDQPLATSPWKGPSAGEAWAWRVNCIGGSALVPALSATGTPRIGRSFSLELDRARSSAPALLLFGASRSTWGPFALPLDLTPAGAPGCGLLCSFDLPVAAQADAGGQATMPVSLPNDQGLIQVVFHDQWIVLDAGANKLGLAFSNGGTGIIGP